MAIIVIVLILHASVVTCRMSVLWNCIMQAVPIANVCFDESINEYNFGGQERNRKRQIHVVPSKNTLSETLSKSNSSCGSGIIVSCRLRVSIVPFVSFSGHVSPRQSFMRNDRSGVTHAKS